MPVQTSYPGVYVEEIPSGVRTITGVATSITAFIGRSLRGRENDPATINSFSEFQRQFGDLWVESTMSYAVQDFYLNGGSQAVILRIAPGADKAVINLPVSLTSPPSAEFNLTATSPGEWANNLLASVDYNTSDPLVAVTSPPATPDPDLFNLFIYEKNPETNKDIKVEEYLGVSMDPGSLRFLPRLLEQNSPRLNINKDDAGNYPTSRPDITAANVGVTTAGSNGTVPVENDYTPAIELLRTVDLFNLLCIPPPQRGESTPPVVYSNAIPVCVERRAMLIVDPPFSWASLPDKVVENPKTNLSSLLITGTDARNAALYYPLIKKSDPKRNNQLDYFVPCGTIAGIMAKTDTNRGVWKAPAGIDAGMNGVQGLQAKLTDLQNGDLNKIGINCLRSFPDSGSVVWGARTLRGADSLGDEYKYVSVRRTALFIEESLFRGTKWIVFEPNDERLWAQIRLNVGAFMHNLFRQGAFQGNTPKEAYLVKCDSETTTQNDINLGIVNIYVGFQPLKPAEFVILKIQQLAGQIES